MIVRGIQLSKTYGGRKVLNLVDLGCAAGELCGLVGVNGAGKTTLFKILLGLVSPDHGEVRVPSGKHKTIGGIVEKPSLYPYLNAYENLKVFASLQNSPAEKEFLKLQLQRVGLPLDRLDPVRNFSLGMKQRLGIAVALLNDPQCLILDEPFSGLDPIGIESLSRLLRNLAKEQQLAVVISSHIIDRLIELCDRLYVIDEGEIVTSGQTSQVVDLATTAYTLKADNLYLSQRLRSFGVEVTGNSSTVPVPKEGIAELLGALLADGIKITSCEPQIDMNTLFQKKRG